jgi:uncharacterized protein with PQ loop repeat
MTRRATNVRKRFWIIKMKNALAKINDKQLDAVVLVLGFLEPIFALPQVIHIFHTKTAAGLSLITWLLYLLSSFIMIIWGIKRGLKPIYIPQAVWIVLEIIIIYGIIKYT